MSRYFQRHDTLLSIYLTGRESRVYYFLREIPNQAVCDKEKIHPRETRVFSWLAVVSEKVLRYPLEHLSLCQSPRLKAVYSHDCRVD